MNVEMTICRSRDHAEKRKEHVRSLAPDLAWRTRIIENATTWNVVAANAPSEFPDDICSDAVKDENENTITGAILLMWIES